MTLAQSIILGIVQGLTEFLPVSSSGHLLLLEHWMGLPQDQLQDFDVLLHGGTLVALILCYPKEWWRMARAPFTGDRPNIRLLLLLVLATIPGAVAGYFLADIIEGSLRTTGSVGYEFIVNGIILILAERFAQTRSREDTRVVDALLIGCAQALALSPGLSRSALTIAAGRALNFRRRDALDFSFLMATPIIAGATIFAATDIAQGGVLLPSLPVIVAGITSALCASVVAILFLRAFVAKKSLALFAWYLIPMGLLLCFAS
ncbi:MAG: undecaprenyl-diphosphate phosphatase [Patescibacteria group bacterium]